MARAPVALTCGVSAGAVMFGARLAQGRWEVSMECEEEIGQVGEIWRILEELNGENIPLELEMHPSEL